MIVALRTWMIALSFVALGLVPAADADPRTYGTPPRLSELTEEQRELLRLAESLAVPLTEERVMYHYGNPAPCEKLAEAGAYTGDVYEKYSRLSEKGGAIAGHGVYIAGNPHSSANYFKGGAVEAVLAPGTPVIDLTDRGVTARMYALGLTEEDIRNLPIRGVVKYNASYDWYVIKGPVGVSFRPMDFGRLSDVEFSKFLEEVSWSSVPKANTGAVAQVVQRIDSAGSARGRLAAIWIQGSAKSLDLGRMGQLSQEAQWAGLETMRKDGTLEQALESLRWGFSTSQQSPGLQSLGQYIASLQEDRAKWIGQFLDVAYNPVTHLAALPESARSEAFEHLRQTGTLDETLRRLSVRLDEAESADVYRSLKAYLSSPGEGKMKVLTDYLFSSSFDGIKRLMDFPVPVQDQVIRSVIRTVPWVQSSRLLTSPYNATPEQIRRLDEIKQSMRAEILRQVSLQGKVPSDLIPELFALATVDEGNWVKDWELKAWVQSMSASDREALSRSARQWLNSFEQGGNASEFARVHEFKPVGRVISALESAEAGARSPAAVSTTGGLAERYNRILKDRFKVGRPSLPDLHSGPVAQYCSAKLASTLEGLRLLGPPILIGTIPGATLIYLSVSRKLEIRDTLKSLCAREGGQFLAPSGDAPGGCRCSGPHGPKDVQFTWENIGKRDEQSPLCGGAAP